MSREETIKFECRLGDYTYYLKKGKFSNYYYIYHINHFVDYGDVTDVYRDNTEFSPEENKMLDREFLKLLRESIYYFKFKKIIKIMDLCPYDAFLYYALEYPIFTSVSNPNLKSLLLFKQSQYQEYKKLKEKTADKNDTVLKQVTAQNSNEERQDN